MNFDKEGSKLEKKCLCVCGGEGGGRCTDTKTVCKTVFFFFLFNIFFFNFLIFFLFNFFFF